MKNKYQRLSKEEKKQARLDFKKSEENHNKLYERLTRVRAIGVFGILYSILSFLYDFYSQAEIYIFIIDGFLLIFCLVFIIKATELRNRQVNQFLIKQMTKVEEKKPTKKEKKSKNEGH